MLKKGTMRPLKKVLGVLLVVIGVGSLLKISQITDIVNTWSFVKDLVLIVSGYLLYIAGRQL